MEISNQIKLDILKELLAPESYNYRLVYLHKDENGKFYINDIFGDLEFQNVYDIDNYSFRYVMRKYDEAIAKGLPYDKVLCLNRRGDDTWVKSGIELTLSKIFAHFTNNITVDRFVEIFSIIREKYKNNL